MLHLKREVRDIKRFNQILFILAEEGFGYLFQRFKKKELREHEKPRRLVKAFERLGPTFIKLGQILSLRPDLVPKEYLKALGELQDKVPPFPLKVAEKIIKEELGKPIPQLFKKFDKKPIASASVSQVYKAVLKTGETVAVKIQRPGIKQQMETDIEIMRYLTKLIEKHSKLVQTIDPLKLIDEFEEWTERELDFSNEAENARKFHENFKDSKTVKIPKVYDSLSTRKVLILEFIEGVELHYLDKLKEKKGYNIKAIMKNGFDSILTQVFIHGFFHADPHPGNILVLKNNKISFIDFGIVGYFDESLKKKSIELFYGIIEEDMDAVADAFLDMGMVDEEATNIESFKREIKLIVDSLQKTKLKDVKISYVLEKVLDVCFKHKVKMPIDFVLFGKAIVEFEGIGLEYEPDFVFSDAAKPFLEKLIKKQFSVKTMAKELQKNALRYGKFLRDLPDQVSSVLKKVQKGTIKIDVQDTDVKQLGRDIDRSSNRLTYGLIIAAFLITGALLVDVGKPGFYGYSMISVLSFGLALMFLALLIISILNEVKQ
ncbi:MAG TPA: AarF/ABC1/UbiB kinase family protein [Candidatus Nanoarchaeia archaeon]|nr:AarF/ABC1/UbiB kinase family protein [Candidatus Nanoarchaeia archaeon]